MKVAVDRSVLLKSLGHVQSVVERKGTIPILANIKLDASDEQMELTATDMDMAEVERLNAAIDAPGAVTVPAHMLYDIVRKLPEGAEVRLEEKDGNVAISAAHSRFSLPTLPVDDFPAMAEGDLAHTFVLSAAECRALVEKTRFAMSTEETRYYLNGVYLHTAEQDGVQVLRSVATDGHRLARIQVALPAGATGMPGVIIPRKTVGEISKLLEEGMGDVKISLSESKIRFVCGSAILVSKLIDGTFPDYERVIPQGNNRIMEVDSGALAKAVDRVSVISADKARGVKLSLDGGKLTLSASSQEQGHAQETLEVNYSAESMEIGFNARYLLDVLSQIEGGTVQFVLSESSAPALVRDTADVGALYVVMPMRV